MNSIRMLLASLFRRDRDESEMAQELTFHLESRAADLERKGFSTHDAKRQARVEFGCLEGYKENCREARGLRIFDELRTDLRYTVRTLRKQVSFTVTAVLSLALGIGVNLSIFAALSSMVLHPFPYPNLSRIVSLAEIRTSAPADRGAVAPANYSDWKRQSRSFEYLAAYRDWEVNLTGVDRPDHIHAALASSEFFQILDLAPVMGRTFTAAECEPGSDSVIVISRGFWQTHLASAGDVIGRTISLGGRKYTVIGVMPDAFNLPLSAALWAPLAFTAADKEERRLQQVAVIGKLRGDVPQEQAAAEMQAISQRLERQYPRTNDQRRAQLTLFRDMMKTESDQFLSVLACAALFVLLLACTNVSSLQVARVISREREIGLRASLGAGYFRIFRQLLIENFVIGLAAGVLGLLLAAWDLQIIRSNIPPMVYQIVAGLKDMTINGEVAAYAVALSLATGVVCCVPAIFQVTRSGSSKDLNEVLKEGGRSLSASPARGRLRNVLVVTEVALAFILLVGAGLMVGALQRIVTLKLGYDPNNVLTAEVSLSGDKYDNPVKMTLFYDRVLQTLKQSKGVEGAATVATIGAADSVSIEGRSQSRPGELKPEVQSTTSQYLRVMRIPLLKGRWISEQDALQTPRVVVLSTSVVREYWPNSNPLGQHIKFGPDGKFLTVIGVTADVKEWFLGTAVPTAYVPYQQAPLPSAMLVVRGVHDSRKLAGTVRAAAEALDHEQPLYNIRTLGQRLHEETSGVRNAATMMVTYAVIALLLAISGTYSISSFFVSQRTREIGVRMSLGATRQIILQMVLRHSCRLTGIGLLIGIPLAILLTIGMSHALYNVVAVQPVIFALILMVLGSAAAFAGYIPARRAANVDPMVALRHE